MITVFEQFAPKYKKIVRNFALTVWKWGSQSAESRKAEQELYKKADTFRMRYERALKEYYREKEIRIWPGTIRAKGQEWLREQKALAQTVRVVADAKKNKLAAEEFEKLRKESPGDVQRLLNKVYLTPDEQKRGDNVFGVFSFKDEMAKRAEQIGEEGAFDLGSKINDAVVSDLGDRYKWCTQEDSRVRKTHRKLNGKTFLWTNPPTTIDEYGNKHTGHTGSDYGCVVGSSGIVFNSKIKRLFRRPYTGKLTTIVTKAGALHLTPNHPVLTARGWIAAHAVKFGDKLVEIPGQVLKRIVQDVQHDVACADELFDLFELFNAPRRVRGLASQFHGDGLPQYEINVIAANRRLRDKVDAVAFQSVGKFFFADSDKVRGLIAKPTLCNFSPKLRRLLFTASRFVCFFRERLFFFVRHSTHSQKVSLRPGARSYARSKQRATNQRATNLKASSASQFTKAAVIQADDLCGVDPQNFTRALCVIHTHYSGHVYNFETETGAYYANGLASHNCRCYAEPSKGKPLIDFVAIA